VAEVLQLPPINQIGRPVQILNSFGSKVRFVQAVRELEQEIYRAA
jgi:type I restriction enzyme R subunit